MVSFLVSCLTIIVIALGSVVVLNNMVQQPAGSAFASSTGVELRTELQH
jgi:hypothetical protein